MQKTALYLMFIGILGCAESIPRKPVVRKSGTQIQRSIAINKQIKALEEAKIQDIVKKDTVNTYLNSGNGFWYFYTHKIKTDSITPQPGDLVNFSYNIKSIDGDVIYSKAVLNNKTYRIDKEELIFGLREALKLLKVNESATFLFPSHLAYGFYGDLEKIGRNTPIISEVTLNSIQKINEN